MEEKEKGKYNDKKGTSKLFEAIKDFQALPDHARKTYQKKRTKVCNFLYIF